MIDFMRIDTGDITWFVVVGLVAIGLIALFSYSMRPKRVRVVETRREPLV